MTATVVSTSERDPTKFATAIRQLAEGRSNAVGVVTLTNSVTSTTVVAPNCAQSSSVILFEASSAAAQERAAGTCYVNVANVSNGQFVITHSQNNTTRTFFWVALG